MQNGTINVIDLCRKLSVALCDECGPVSVERLQELLFQRSASIAGIHFFKDSAGNDYISLGCMFAIYADWVTDIGIEVGFDCVNDESAGEWVTDSMPSVASILRDIRTLTVAEISAVDEQMKSQYGYSAADVLIRSVNSCEPLEQSRARLHAERAGLQSVK